MTYSESESKITRNVGLAVAVALAVAFFIWTHAYWAPLHTGVDQNGYLVGGKIFSRTLLPRQSPTVPGRPGVPDPHAFVANMWVAAANDPTSFDPKYPVGLPLLYAVLIWTSAGGTTAAYYLSPIAMALTLPGVFLIASRFANTYGGLLATLAFAVSPMTGSLANNPNSHAVTVCLATWGMAAVLHWWHCGGWKWAVLGGFLVGYCTSVRYTEGLLVLPLLWTALVRPHARRSTPFVAAIGAADPPAPSRTPFRSRLRGLLRRFVEPMLLLAAWASPVAALATYNLLLLGTLTGYDSTNESTGFAWVYFFENWETLLRNFSATGLFLLLPLSLVGLVLIVWRDWRRAGFLWLWVAPSAGLYAFYYWGPDGIGYLRFFMTILPPLLAAAVWVMTSSLWRAANEVSVVPAKPPRLGSFGRMLRVVAIVVAGTIAGSTVFYGVRYSTDAASGKRVLTPLREYLQRPPTAYQRAGNEVAFYSGVVLAAAAGMAIAATTRRSVGALAAGTVALLSVGTTAESTRLTLELAGYESGMWQATADAVRQAVPDGAMLVCREESLLQHLQFVTDNRLYTGLSFDRGWVNGRPHAASDDPVLIDPVRGQQLIKALKDPTGKDFDQKALDEQARGAIKSALATRRRVFVVDSTPPEPLRTALRKKEEGTVPEFVRRYVRTKDSGLLSQRVGWWTVPQPVKDQWASIPRGRRGPTARPNFRTTCYQVWEVTAG